VLAKKNARARSAQKKSPQTRSKEGLKAEEVERKGERPRPAGWEDGRSHAVPSEMEKKKVPQPSLSKMDGTSSIPGFWKEEE